MPKVSWNFTFDAISSYGCKFPDAKDNRSSVVVFSNLHIGLWENIDDRILNLGYYRQGNVNLSKVVKFDAIKDDPFPEENKEAEFYFKLL